MAFCFGTFRLQTAEKSRGWLEIRRFLDQTNRLGATYFWKKIRKNETHEKFSKTSICFLKFFDFVFAKKIRAMFSSLYYRLRFSLCLKVLQGLPALLYFWNFLDGPELDGPEIFWKKLPKSINEIWTVFKLINKLPNNYNFNTRCTAKRCNLYFLGNYWVTYWWVWKLSKFHWCFVGKFFSKNLMPI